MSELTLVERVLEAERKAATLRIRIQELATDRRRIFSEHFAAPMRPARAAWFDAWRGVADASDVVVAARSLEDAGAAFQEMDRVAACWLASATDWVGRVRVYCPTNTCPVGQDAIDMPPHYPGVGEDEVGRWRRDCGEFAVWAISLGSAGPLLAMPDRMPLATHIPADGPVSRGVQLLRLTACPTTAASFVELLGVWGGIGWLGGLSAALAVSVAPPPEGHEFRPVDLPAGGGQRGQADYLLRLAISAFGGGGWIENFRRTHIDVQVVPAPSARSAVGTELVTTTEEATPNATAQVAAEALGPSVPVVTVPEADGHQPAEVEVQERQPDGPGDPLDFWYGGVRHRFESGIARLDSLLRVLWPGFTAARSFATVNVASDYRELRGDETRVPGRPRMAADARELNDWLSRTVAPGRWLEATQDYIRWVGPPRQQENNAMPRG